MRTIDQMVQSEVLVCLSSLVSTLAGGQGNVKGRCELAPLVEQAAELCYPIPDYEEAAMQDGWTLAGTESDRAMVFTHKDGRVNRNTTWGELCDEQGLEPYEWEVFEHWAVTSWFAEKLAAAGEKVDTDFAGMCVWARTTSGQGIASDGVIERIYAELCK